MEKAPFTTDPQDMTMGDLTSFGRWSVFLPTEVCLDSERSAVYVQSRQSGNPRFFEHMRDRLLSTIQDFTTQRAGGKELVHGRDLVEALHLVLQAQWTAHGFQVCREFHKVLNLAKPCVELVDDLCTGQPELLFWIVLARATLGIAYVGFRKYDDARDVLYKAIELLEHSERLNAREQVMLGTCYAHLGRLEWAVGNMEEALRCAELQIKLFQCYLPGLLESEEDHEVHANVMASAFSFCGLCDCRQERYDKAMSCFQMAEDLVEKYKTFNKDALAISTNVEERMRQTKDAKHLQNIREEYAATGGPIPV